MCMIGLSKFSFCKSFAPSLLKSKSDQILPFNQMQHDPENWKRSLKVFFASPVHDLNGIESDCVLWGQNLAWTFYSALWGGFHLED